MILNALELDFFRNYVHFQSSFHPRVNLIYGENAQGKTNLLEAMAYLSSARSHRARYDREMILLGVDAALIEQYNVVSGPVAVAMAFGAARASGAELAVGITGIAGPGGALPGKPVGTVYLAGADTRTNTGWLMRLTLGGYHDRGIIRTRAALYALDLLRRMALGLPVPDGMAVTPETPPEESNI